MSNTTKKKIISLEVRDEYILGSGVAIGAQGSFDSSVLRVKFDDNWRGLNIYATWTDALGNVGDQTIVTVIDLVDGEANTYDIPVSKFATQHAGTVKLALSGYVIGGEEGNEIESLLNTVSGAFRVLESSATPLDGGKSEASVAEQLLNSVNEFEEGIENRMSSLEGEMDEWDDALDKAENGYTDDDGKYVPGRVENEQERQENEDARAEAEKQRQINEFGNVGYRWNGERTAVVDENGDTVENANAGRVGAELARQDAETKRQEDTAQAISRLDNAVDYIKGDDFKSEIIGGVIEALPTWEGGSY